ncbi:hypothetical protein PQR15_18310 [Streptomyces lydicus]|nr:hypothetical protein [Streptomyces lydicus]
MQPAPDSRSIPLAAPSAVRSTASSPRVSRARSSGSAARSGAGAASRASSRTAASWATPGRAGLVARYTVRRPAVAVSTRIPGPTNVTTPASASASSCSARSGGGPELRWVPIAKRPSASLT